MNLLRTWLRAARLRTLPLSFSGILIGSAFALNENFNFFIFFSCLIITVLFQVISNFANDLGDAIKGVDDHTRIGPKRAIQSGLITKVQMKKAIVFFCFMALFMVLQLLMNIDLRRIELMFFLAFGIVAIWAAIAYTIGKKPYGYRALGDLMVFLFFGLLAVLGTFYLHLRRINLEVLFIAFAIGTLAVAVLNLNNMRDREDDALKNKITMAVILGAEKSKKYQMLLLIVSLLTFLIGITLSGRFWYFIAMLPLIRLVGHVNRIKQVKNNLDFDPELKVIAISSFMSSLLCFIIGLIVYF
ncbi:MAG: 1,4-dihydroxy-2-naphthoate octaprenyltransferase [Flavobacteriaceae bacterium]|nr:1,4-dihydroxy-2-naphthoate octaprenyltransferase [Flavobacteriaceae bacterium]OUX39132.1 MAG: 1,4-dihydroxy-2-naphthoate octaprenyltransferase [Flavobacteriaceae bacterium TMED265]